MDILLLLLLTTFGWEVCHQDLIEVIIVGIECILGSCAALFSRGTILGNYTRRHSTCLISRVRGHYCRQIVVVIYGSARISDSRVNWRTRCWLITALPCMPTIIIMYLVYFGILPCSGRRPPSSLSHSPHCQSVTDFIPPSGIQHYCHARGCQLPQPCSIL